MAILFHTHQLLVPLKTGKRLVAKYFLSKKNLIFVLIFGGILSLGLAQIVLPFGKYLLFNSTIAAAPPISTQLSQVSGKVKELVINTTTCKIPKFPVWSLEAQKLLPIRCKDYFLGDPKCGEKHVHAWSYLKNSHIHINLTAVLESGYSWNSIRCCYRVIQRVNQALGKEDIDADRVVQQSERCYPITQTRQFIDADFIRFKCVSTTMPFSGDVVSQEFFANVQPDAMAKAKMEKWASISKRLFKNDRPPNVIILGIDTMSRLNSIRNFEKSRSVLKSIGAVEMEGYTKNGETTFPNTVAFLSGYNLRQLRNFCFQNSSQPFDKCPFIWKYFSRMDYLTSTMEDVVLNTPFNFGKLGFVNKPVDFYFRPFMLSVMKHLRRPNQKYLRCLGSKQLEQVFLEYIENMLEMAQPSGTPVFVHLWLTSLAHECGVSPKYTDWIFAKHILRISKLYENTVIIFMGDHGELFGEFRETMQGWYEDNLPMFWIYLPDVLKDRFPDWLQALKTNSERLTSHFDLYKTFVHILETFDRNNILKSEVYDKQIGQFGQSLFMEIEENRKCSDAGVMDGYCACSAPREIDMKSEKVMRAISEAIKYVIQMIPADVCDTPVLQKVVNAKVIPMLEGYDVYMVSFFTDPGHFLFEATVRERNGEFQVTNDVLRVNQIKRKVNCIKTNAYLERYCYCK